MVLEHRDDLDWADKNLDRFVGLENFLDRTTPTTAFSYVRFRGEMAAVIRRHDDGTGSQGRSRADILIGHQDDLEATTALGLEGLDEVWNVAVPFNRRLSGIRAQVLVDQAARELPANMRRTEVREHARQVLAAMGTYKDKRLLLVGMQEELKKPLLLVVEDVRKRHPDLFGTVGLTFSTYEAHSQDVQGTPGFVFVPDYPPTGTRRVVVDLTLSGRSRDVPSQDMVACADEALSSMLDDRPARWLADAASAGTAQRPALVGAGGGRATQAPPADPTRGPGPLSHPDGGQGGLPYSYTDTGVSSRGGADARGPEPDERPTGRSPVRTHKWVTDLLDAATLDEFKHACDRMMKEQPDPVGRRVALTPSTTLLDVYRHGVDLASATGGWQDPVRGRVLALAFGHDYAELDKPEGADYLFRLVRATARCSADDFDAVKDLMAEVVRRFRNLRRGSSELTTVLVNDYFESLGLEPLKAGRSTGRPRVLGSGGGSGRGRPQLTAGLDRLQTAFQRDGRPGAASSWSSLPGKERNGPSAATMVAVIAGLVATALVVFVLLQAGRNDGTSAPVATSPTTSPEAQTTPSVVAPSAAPPTSPVVQVAALTQVARTALPLEAGGQSADSVVYVVWRSPSGAVVFGKQCELNGATGAFMAYLCPTETKPAEAAATGEVIVVASTKAVFDQKGGTAAEAFNSAGLVVGMTPLTAPTPY